MKRLITLLSLALACAGCATYGDAGYGHDRTSRATIYSGYGYPVYRAYPAYGYSVPRHDRRYHDRHRRYYGHAYRPRGSNDQGHWHRHDRRAHHDWAGRSEHRHMNWRSHARGQHGWHNSSHHRARRATHFSRSHHSGHSHSRSGHARREH